MPDLGLVEWIILGFVAGAISGALVGGRTARGCLPNIVVGILGGVVGGWLADPMGLTPVTGFLAVILAAVLGSIIVRLVLNAISGNR
jgi:uncharacterized membrane protein YeaQ/YmgE (transglycosylase-associated protein family)